MTTIPLELTQYFSQRDFQEYPKVRIPQQFTDARGDIVNIADGILGDVAVINSKAGSVRANHVHLSDWHLSYCVSGSLNYSFMHSEGQVRTSRIVGGELFFTPQQTPHRMDFVEDTILVVVSRNSRKRDQYDQDTKAFILRNESGI